MDFWQRKASYFRSLRHVLCAVRISILRSEIKNPLSPEKERGHFSRPVHQKADNRKLHNLYVLAYASKEALSDAILVLAF
jgi:hypothetical protein